MNLAQLRKPLWLCLINRALELGRRCDRRHSNFDPLARGVHLRLEDGALFIEPNPAPLIGDYFL